MTTFRKSIIIHRTSSVSINGNLDTHSSTIVALGVFRILWGSERLISPSVADIGHQQRSKSIPHSESKPPRSGLPSCGEGSDLHDFFCLLWAGAYRIQDALPIPSSNPSTPTFVQAWLPHFIVPISFDANIRLSAHCNRFVNPEPKMRSTRRSTSDLHRALEHTYYA
jgi:hypothetical protein